MLRHQLNNFPICLNPTTQGGWWRRNVKIDILKKGILANVEIDIMKIEKLTTVNKC